VGVPNVVLIVLDDLGFADLGCYGSRIATPRIDELASGGLRFNGFHVTALCSPTRACLVTGRNQHVVGMGWLADRPTEGPGYSVRIPKSAGSVARLLRERGYNTFAVGKWHLVPASERGPAGPFERWPLGMGFERYYGFTGSMTDQWRPVLIRDNSLVEPPGLPADGYHLSEDQTSTEVETTRAANASESSRPPVSAMVTNSLVVPWAQHATRRAGSEIQ